MGDRYFIPVECPVCGNVDEDVYYAPTCDFTDHNCTKCNELIDLMELTGITYEDASNLTEIEALVEIIAADTPSDCWEFEDEPFTVFCPPIIPS